MFKLFRDRADAAKKLASRLTEFREERNALVLAIPHGGVPVGQVISEELAIPLDIILSKKIVHPRHKEYAIGAVSHTEIILNAGMEVPETYLQAEILRLKELLRERFHLFKGRSESLSVRNRAIVLVDDGVATGQTMLATIRMLKKQGVAEIVIAVPVISTDARRMLRPEVSDIISLSTPYDFRGVGQFYQDFRHVSDDEVIRLLNVRNISVAS